MHKYTFTKTVNPSGLLADIKSVLNQVSHVNYYGDQVSIYFPSELVPDDYNVMYATLENHAKQFYDTKDYVKSSVGSAIEFGQQVLVEFGTENVLLGIQQYNETNRVRRVMAQVSSAISSGALTDAIYETRQIPVEERDAIFLSAARLLKYVNLIETYLGVPLSNEL